MYYVFQILMIMEIINNIKNVFYHKIVKVHEFFDSITKKLEG